MKKFDPRDDGIQEDDYGEDSNADSGETSFGEA